MVAGPTFGWLIGLTNYMNDRYPEAWCYSGSFAMYCHAAARNVQARQPADIDILTSRLPEVWYDIRQALDAQLRGPPGPRTQKATISEARLYAGPNGDQATLAKIDVLAEGARFGYVANAITLHQQTTLLRLLPLTDLIARKRAILDEDDEGEEAEKATTDIVFMQGLG